MHAAASGCAVKHAAATAVALRDTIRAVQARLAPVSWERMTRAVEKVRERLSRATTALSGAHIPYAVIDGNAIAAWVSRVDEAAVRNTCDVSLLLRRAYLDDATQVLAMAGHHRPQDGIEVFLNARDAKTRNGVHLVFAGERVRPDDFEPAPEVTEVDDSGPFSLMELLPLLRMQLTSFRDQDRMHVRDLLDVGLVDASFCDRLSPPLATRLRQLLDTPE